MSAAKDKYSAVWVSHSSMSDYLKCPRAYYLRNVYRNPKTNHKMSVMQPALALGQSVHEVIESLSVLPSEERFKESLLIKFDGAWAKITGKKGGFKNEIDENAYKDRGKAMITRIMENPGPLREKAIKIRQDLPYFWLSEEENIILCGKIDWLQYVSETDSVKIIDFKTGKHDEDPDSLQLPIYCLLVQNTQQRSIHGICYWYLDRDSSPMDVAIPDLDIARGRLLEIAKTIALARKLERFLCKQKDGCMACRPYEAVLAGKGFYVGVNDFGQDIYTV